MKKILNLSLSFCFALTIIASQSVMADESVVVVVNESNKQSLTKQQIKNIYSDIVISWENGKKIKVYHLPVDDKAREVFSQSIFGESAQKQASSELNRKITNSIKNPTNTKRARLVAIMVSRNPHAIGYLPADMVEKVDNIRKVLTLN